MLVKNHETGAIEGLDYDSAVAAVTAGTHAFVNLDADGKPKPEDATVEVEANPTQEPVREPVPAPLGSAILINAAGAGVLGGNGGSGGTLPSTETKPLGEMTKAELVEYAKAHDVEIDAGANKAEILAAIETHKPVVVPAVDTPERT